MRKQFKKEASISKSKTIKLGFHTHKLLRMYAAENDPRLRETVRNLLDKNTEIKSGN